MRTKKYFSVFLVFLAFLCTGHLLCAQDSTKIDALSEQLTRYKEVLAPEKVYLQTDKDYYTNGDTLWFKTYLVDGISHGVSDKSRVVYVELVDAEQKVIERRSIYTGFKGGSGDIALEENIEEGLYSLRAYTEYMLNEKQPVFFRKEIPIWTYTINSKKNRGEAPEKKKTTKDSKDQLVPNITPKTTVRFFPEGGNLVFGLNNILGLKIMDGRGAGIPLTGKIIDENGSLITMFSTTEFGLGRVQFRAEPDTDYFAEIEMNGKREKHKISKPLAKGYVLHVSNKGGYLQVRVSTTITNGLNGSVLLGHVRGELILKYIAENRTDNSYEVKLSTAEMNDGVGTFTLFTPEGKPVCERLVFIENPNNILNLSPKTDASNYGLRKKVNVEIAVLDESGLPLSGNLAMSVSSQNALQNQGANIKSWLLLNSDLGGTVENPNYFFEDDSKSRKNLLDILMLTHGWRRFVWHELESDQMEVPLRYPPEKGIVITGKTVDTKNRQEPLQSSVSLNITEPSTYTEDTVTDAQGKFSFGPIIFRDSIKALIKASPKMDDTKEAAIYLESPFPTLPIRDSLNGRTPNMDTAQSNAYREEAYNKKVNDFEYDPKVIKLDEAIGSGKLKTKKELINEALNERTMYGQALNRVIPDSILDSQSLSVIDLIERQMAVYKIRGSYPNQKIELRPCMSSKAAIRSSESPKDPLYLLDGIPVDPSLVNEMFGTEILFIDVLKSAGETAQYGMRGGCGVIAVYTKRGENYEFVQEKELDVADFILPGFYGAREFYSPIYPLLKTGQDKPDFRTTLYWVPEINLSELEPTKLAFYTGDSPGTYTIRVEGMTADGKPISGLHTFTIGED